MNILVLYYSKTGSTEKLAQAIARGVESVGGVTAAIKTADEVSKDDFSSADAIIAGSPVYFGTLAWPLKKVFDEFVSLRKSMEGKVGAAFATSGSATGGKETTIFSIIQAMMIYGMIIVGDPMDATGHYGTASLGSPDTEAEANGHKLGKRVAEVTRKLRSR